MVAMFRSIINFGQHHIENFNATAAVEEIREVLHLHDLELRDLPEAITKYIQENPKQSAHRLFTILRMLYPGVVFAPLWLALGLTPVGPVAGGIFAGLQSAIGTPLPMRIIQGAAMGGRARAVLYELVQGAATFEATFDDVFKAANGTGGT